jgi:uncharacterized protein
MRLQLGYNHPFEIRKYRHPDENLAGTSILYLSDFHFTRFGRRAMENICTVTDRLNPDIILLGGDYADSRKGMFYFERMMSSLTRSRHVFAIAGNHDLPRLNQVRAIVEASHAVWINKRSVNLSYKHSTIRIDGTRPAHMPAAAARPDLSILCLHRPIDVAPFADKYDLIFAGHLHGSQIVFRSTENGLYPGRLIYKWNRLSATYGPTQYLISKGLGDTLPIRYNCSRDAVLVEICRPIIPDPNTPKP